ncbi:hypothetical protein D3C80_1820410 [compost metagenome]
MRQSLTDIFPGVDGHGGGPAEFIVVFGEPLTKQLPERIGVLAVETEELALSPEGLRKPKVIIVRSEVPIRSHLCSGMRQRK